VIISFLPPLNLLLVLASVFDKASANKLTNVKSLIFIPAIFFSVYYTFIIPEFAVTGCTVLYATYSDKKKKLVGKFLLFGALFISIPPSLGFILMFAGSYSLISAMESVMCKFAFVYALCLSFICIYNSPFKDERNYFKYLSGYK
jgi:hypothetical protein